MYYKHQKSKYEEAMKKLEEEKELLIERIIVKFGIQDAVKGDVK